MADEPSNVAGLLAELVRAANKVDHLTMSEMSGLMNRSAATIADLRDRVTFAASSTGRDLGGLSTELRSMALTPEVFSADNVRSILLSAAETIRTLKIVLDHEASLARERAEGRAAST